MDRLTDGDKRLIDLTAATLEQKYRPRVPILEGTVPLIHYPNRRYYSRLHKRYVTLAEVAQWWRNGDRIIVTSHRTTDPTLTLLKLLTVLVENGEIRISEVQIRALAGLP